MIPTCPLLPLPLHLAHHPRPLGCPSLPGVPLRTDLLLFSSWPRLYLHRRVQRRRRPNRVSLQQQKGNEESLRIITAAALATRLIG